MSQETPQRKPKELPKETLRNLVDAAIKEAQLSPSDATKVRKGVITALEGLGDAGVPVAAPGVEIDLDLCVDDNNRRGFQEVVTETIQSLRSL